MNEYLKPSFVYLEARGCGCEEGNRVRRSGNLDE
jgi:hypothetical protein